MLNKRSRLRANEVAEVIKSGRSARTTHLQVKFVSRSGPFRSAAVAPKSIAKKATDRNRLRRALYRALLSHISANPQSTPKGNAVFFVRLVPKEALSSAFLAELPSLFSKLS
jgi:ribonuclease P protein component